MTDKDAELAEALTGLAQAGEGLAYLVIAGVLLVGFLWLTGP